MNKTDKLRVGHIPYLNCHPFFHHLSACGFDGEIIQGVPSQLNQMLQEGRVDISPSSSFEYALHSRDYLLLPDLSISSCGPVKSVLLFSPCRLPELKGQSIALTGESATSINLLRVLLREYYAHEQVADFVPQGDVEALIAEKKPALLIGDRAMHQAAQHPVGMRVYDLGELWYQATGLPFVFALWILRRESAANKAEALHRLRDQLACSIRAAFADLDALAIGEEAERAFLVDYWQTIDYRLGPRHLEGLSLYWRLCQKYGLLTEVAAPEFFVG